MAAGQLVFDLVARTDRFTKNINRANQGVSKFVSQSVNALAKFNLAIGGVQTALSAMTEPLALADTQIKAERKLERVLESTGHVAGFAADEIKKFAAERQKLTNFGDEATIDAAGVLGSFTNIRGEQFKGALVAAQDLSAFLGTDLQSSIIQVGKALNDPARGLSALSRSGIQFSEAQKETIKRLQDTGRIADAQRMILREFTTQFGGQARALADPITQAKNAWGDFLEEVGFGLREIAVEVLKSFGFEDATTSMSDFVRQFRTEWKDDIVEAIKDTVATGKDLLAVFQEIGKAIKPIVAGAKGLDNVIKKATGGAGKLGDMWKLPGAGLGAGFLVGGAKKSLEGMGLTGNKGGDPSNFFTGLADGFTETLTKDLPQKAALKPAPFDEVIADQGPMIPPEVLKERQSMMKEAERIAEAVKTPVERFQDEMSNLTRLFESGMISDDLFDRASQAAVDRLPVEKMAEQAKKDIARNEVRGLRAGSSDALDVMRNALGPGKPEDKQLKESQKTNKLLGDIKKELGKSGNGNIEVRGFD